MDSGGLVGDPAGTLKTIGKFIDHDLDYDRIQRTALGTAAKPNTSFNEELTQGHFAPIGRWKTECSPDDIRSCEQVIGSFLEELGYPLASSSTGSYGPGTLATRSLSMSYFGAKQWLKSHTPLGKFMMHTGMWMTQPIPSDPREAGSVAGGHS